MRRLLAALAAILASSVACTGGLKGFGESFDDAAVWGRLKAADLEALAMCPATWTRLPMERDRIVDLPVAAIVPLCGLGVVTACQAAVLNELHPAPPHADFGRPVSPGFVAVNGVCSEWLKERTQGLHFRRGSGDAGVTATRLRGTETLALAAESGVRSLPPASPGAAQ